MPLQPGSMFESKYSVLETLGSGGVGVVYKALQVDCNRIVALKILKESTERDSDFTARLQREALALSKLSHPNIVLVYNFGLSNEGIPYIAMEFVEGRSLRALINDGGISLLKALRIAKFAASALNYAHKNGIVHRDLKPENIVLAATPEADTVKIIDFGLASFQGPMLLKLTQSGHLIGTAEYMSPEQAAGKVAGPASDIYALSVCLFEMISGNRPFDADNAIGILYKHQNEQPPDLSELQRYPSINSIIKKGLAMKPEDRFESMAEFADELQDAIDQFAESKTEVIASGSRKALVIAIALVAIVASLVAFLTFGTSLQSTTPSIDPSAILKLPSDLASNRLLESIKTAQASDIKLATRYYESVRDSAKFQKWPVAEQESFIYRCFVLLNDQNEGLKQTISIDAMELIFRRVKDEDLIEHPMSDEAKNRLSELIKYLLEHPCKDQKLLVRLNKVLLSRTDVKGKGSRVIYFIYPTNSKQSENLHLLAADSLLKAKSRSISGYREMASLLYFDAASSSRLLGDESRMLSLSTKALELDPNNPEAKIRNHIFRAFAYKDENRAKSEDELAQAEKLMPPLEQRVQFFDYYRLLADLYLRKRDFAGLDKIAEECKTLAEKSHTEEIRMYAIRLKALYLMRTGRWGRLEQIIRDYESPPIDKTGLLQIAEEMSENTSAKSTMYLTKIAEVFNRAKLNNELQATHIFLHRVYWETRNFKKQKEEDRVISAMIKNGQNVSVLDRFYVDTLKAAHETSDWTRLFEVAKEARAKESKFDNWVRKEIAYQLAYYYLHHDRNLVAAKDELVRLSAETAADDYRIVEIERDLALADRSHP